MLVTFPGGILIPERPHLNLGASAYQSYLLDAASEKAAGIFQAPRTGTISKVGFVTGTVTTGATVDVRLETVSAADGTPTGTLYGANTNGSQVIGDADDNTWFLTALTSGAAVTKGDVLAAVIVNPSVSPGNLNINAMGKPGNTNFPYSTHFTASWARFTRPPCLALEYSDGKYYFCPGLYPLSSIPNPSYDLNTDPDELGMRFTAEFNCRVTGFWSAFGCTNDIVAKLYNSASELLLSKTIDGDLPQPQSAGFYFTSYFAATKILRQGSVYRLTIAATSAASSVTTCVLAFNAVAIMDTVDGGQNYYLTQRANGGSWTDTTTRRPLIGLIIDQVDAYEGTV